MSKSESRRVVNTAGDAPSRSAKGWVLAGAALLIGSGLAVYANSWHAANIYDGEPFILKNKAIQTLWPLSVPLGGSSRPLVYLTFALNYAWDGLNVEGFHAVNVAIHILAGLTLWGILRRTFALSPLPAPLTSAAEPVALIAALIWLVHPLETQSVTYIYQRLESLMGLFFLLTLYCFIHAATSQKPRLWYGASAAACFLSMSCKEVAAAAPLLVLAYDRLFVGGSWRDLRARRGWYYLLLASSWVWGGYLLARIAPALAAARIGQVRGVTPLEYALSQPGVLVHYLRLCFWPVGQSLDYDWPVAHDARDILPGLLVISGLAVLTAVGLWRSRRIAYLGLWFFLILAPTSSILPIRDLAIEHRMYLPLAAVVVGAVLAVVTVVLRFAPQPVSRRQATGLLAIPAAVAVVLLGNLTLARNDDYATDLSIWQDTCRKSPRNARAQLNVATYLFNEHDYAAAVGYYQEAIRLDPNLVMAHIGLAQILDRQGRGDEALALCRRATLIEASTLDVFGVEDSHAAACRRLAEMLHRHGAIKEAKAQYRRAIELQPSNLQAYTNLATLLYASGQADEARELYRLVLTIDPTCQPARVSLAASLAREQHYEDAVALLVTGLKTAPADAQMHYQLASALASLGRTAEAAEHYRTAARLDPQGKVKQWLSDGQRSKDKPPQPPMSAAISGELE